jgi:CheY-like chemotaxis protein
MEPVSVLVADDHPIVRDGLSVLLSSQSTVDVVGMAADGTKAVQLPDELQPDVVVMDLHMPGTSGINAIGPIVRTSPPIAVLVLTILEDDDSLFVAMRAGARGYLVKAPPRRRFRRRSWPSPGARLSSGPLLRAECSTTSSRATRPRQRARFRALSWYF